MKNKKYVFKSRGENETVRHEIRMMKDKAREGTTTTATTKNGKLSLKSQHKIFLAHTLRKRFAEINSPIFGSEGD